MHTPEARTIVEYIDDPIFFSEFPGCSRPLRFFRRKSVGHINPDAAPGIRDIGRLLLKSLKLITSSNVVFPRSTRSIYCPPGQVINAMCGPCSSCSIPSAKVPKYMHGSRWSWSPTYLHGRGQVDTYLRGASTSRIVPSCLTAIRPPPSRPRRILAHIMFHCRKTSGERARGGGGSNPSSLGEEPDEHVGFTSSLECKKTDFPEDAEDSLVLNLRGYRLFFEVPPPPRCPLGALAGGPAWYSNDLGWKKEVSLPYGNSGGLLERTHVINSRT